MTIIGFGFANTASTEIRSKFTTNEFGELVCNSVSPCIQSATFIDKNTITTTSLAQSSLLIQLSKQTIGTHGVAVEVSVYGGTFTENHVEVFYIY